MMLICLFLKLLLMKFSLVNGFHESECCFKKEVGESRYFLVDEEDTSEYHCESTCVYEKDSEAGSRYCFKTGREPFYCVNEHAPVQTTFTISEGNQTIVQENSFQNNTGILELIVPPHKNYTETVFMLHQESKTSMLKTGDTCQLTDLPEYLNVSAMAGGYETHDKARVEESDKVTTFILKARESRFGSRKRAELVPDAQYLCKDAPLVKTNDVEINATEFEKYDRGEVIFLKTGRNSRLCEQETSCSKQGPDACGYGWTNPAGGGLSFHQVSSGSVCVTCNIFTDIPGTTQCNNDLCLCEDITDKTTLVDCSIKSGANTSIELKGERTNLVQSMLYNKRERARALVISSPAHKDLGALEVVMHGHEDGWWHEGVYSGSLQNNRMMKLGNSCHISTLPSHVFPVDIALGIQEIKAGNDVTTEDDEEDKHEILLNDGFLTPGEENALHSDIKSRCSESSIQKFVETPVSKSQGEDLKNGGIVFIQSKPSRSNCELQTAATTNQGSSGCWRWPNPDGSKLWIHQIVHSVVHVSCCINLVPAIFPTCCADNYGDFCQCQDITDTQTFNQCRNQQTTAITTEKTTEPPVRVETAPPLESGQTRIILSWPDQPNDIDLHVLGFSDGDPCRVYYDDRCACPHVCLDVDNTQGGANGPETVTLQNSIHNAVYTYAIGVYDYSGSNGAFGSSQVKIEATNGTVSYSETLPVSSLPDNSWWFFGCISVTPDNTIIYNPAPPATIFIGTSTSSWYSMVRAYCSISVPTAPAEPGLGTRGFRILPTVETQDTLFGGDDMKIDADYLELPPKN